MPGGPSTRANLLRTFDEPLDESPVPTPPDWWHGAVEWMGGGNYYRTWYRGQHGDVEYMVIYHPTDDQGVSIKRWEGQEYRLVDNHDAPPGDIERARVAREIMRRYSTTEGGAAGAPEPTWSDNEQRDFFFGGGWF